MVSTPSPPPPPDPAATAQAQEQENVGTAIAQAELNDVNQITPYGSITYQRTGWLPGGGGIGGAGRIPQFTATTALSPELQALSSADIANAQGAANIEAGLEKNVASTLETPLDLGPSATSAYLDKLARAELDPQIAQERTALNQTLADQGLTPGSAGWNYQQQQFGLNSAQQYNDLYLQGQNTAMAALEAQYNEPLNALSALQSQSQVSEPGVGTLAPTASSSIAPANYSSDVYNSAADRLAAYQAQLQQSNAITGGLFGIGGALLGNQGLFKSDREDKTDIEPLGRDPGTGLMVHSYRYKEDPKSYPKTVGPMADEVEKKAPDAVRSIAGHKVIAIPLGIRFGLGG